MNKERRKEIAAVKARLEALQGELASIMEAVEDIKSEEQEYFDNMPESLQGGEKGDRAQEAIDALENATSDLDCIDLDAVISSLEDAQA